MVALRSHSDDPCPRSPLAIAEDVRHALKSRSVRRFARVNVRIANGAVALTGSVPNWQSKTLAIDVAQAAFSGMHIIDALEVQNRRTFAGPPICL